MPKDDKLINVVLSGGYNVQPVPIAIDIPIVINIRKDTGLIIHL